VQKRKLILNVVTIKIIIYYALGKTWYERKNIYQFSKNWFWKSL